MRERERSHLKNGGFIVGKEICYMRERTLVIMISRGSCLQKLPSLSCCFFSLVGIFFLFFFCFFHFIFILFIASLDSVYIVRFSVHIQNTLIHMNKHNSSGQSGCGKQWGIDVECQMKYTHLCIHTLAGSNGNGTIMVYNLYDMLFNHFSMMLFECVCV